MPQLADADVLFPSLDRLPGVRYPVLVPTLRGLERAIAAGADEVAVVIGATDSFNRANLNRTTEEALADADAVVAGAKARSMRVRGYVSVAFGCPYEGAVAPSTTASVAGRLVDLGCDEIGLGDTIGAATPGDVDRVLDAVVPVVGVERIGLHAHDTRGQALANVLAALQRGISVIDSSAGGLGGCPFAGPGAVGNLATEDLVYLLDGLGIEHGVSLDGVMAASAFIASRRRPSAAEPDVARRRTAGHAATAGNRRRPGGVTRADTAAGGHDAHPEPPNHDQAGDRSGPPRRPPLAAVAAGPALAKEGFQAFLDAPIGRDTPGGTTLLVGLTVSFPDGSVTHPVEGSPIYLELVGRDGSSVREMGREDTSGHYVVRIDVPPAGISAVEVGVRGTSDLPILLQGTAARSGRDRRADRPGRAAAAAGPDAVHACIRRAAGGRATCGCPAAKRRRSTLGTRRIDLDAHGRAPRGLWIVVGLLAGVALTLAGQPALADDGSRRVVRAGARGLTPSCGRRRPTSPMPPRRCSFGAPRPATRRRTASS